ncbi:MAG TPA: permease [Syntrophorhabdaceae bacterium]|nr:permease [Syntrophorhabdaceae bacterium]HOL05242.1 permease [Syntrophorhabdaceae bacterium]HON84825.1 permease [Syntrophorhabdaceae bacterium]HOT41914.1 permease [Syntrophorhabdaceae bacterium]HPC66403.1 permease [Syntrophorhabdaceae bacterium]
MKDRYKFIILVAAFIGAYFIPFESIKVQKAILEAFYMIQDYAQKHVLLCLVPAFFIAGAISVFVSQAAVMKYLGPAANKLLSYSVASVSGTILAVCSCTVLPLFAGIYRMGAGVGPATAFLYSGPAINVLAIVLSAKVLGWKIGLARAIGAVGFAYIIGILMAVTFKEEEKKKQAMVMPSTDEPKRKLYQEIIYMASMIGVLVFANWGKPMEASGIWYAIYSAKWYLTGLFGVIFGLAIWRWFEAKPLPIIVTGIAVIIASIFFHSWPLIPFSVAIAGTIWITKVSSDETKNWIDATWTYTLMIAPLLLGGVLVAGFLLGMPGTDNGIIPSRWVHALVGGNGFFANLFASIVGAFMYFATLTEVPIVQGLLGSGMGQGPALALLLAGPALSLPSMLVIRTILGTKKTIVFIIYVVLLSTFAGMLFGWITG